MLHLLIALVLAGVLIGLVSAAVYGVGLLRHGRQGMSDRKTQHVMRSYSDDNANDPTGGWAGF